MSRVFVNHPVADYDKWRPIFDADKPRRAAFGVTDLAVLRDTNDPNSIWIVAESDATQLQALLSDPELATVMQDGGVTAPPTWWASHSKEDTIRRGYKAFGEGDMATLASLYSPDVVQCQPGNNKTSGEYKGVDSVLGLYGQLFELSGGTYSVELKSVKTQGDKVVSVHHAKGKREGRTLDADETIEFTFSGDKVTRLDVTYTDQASEDAFWD